MALYFATRPHPHPHPTQPSTDGQTASAHILSDFDKHRKTLLEADTEEGWASEL